MLAVLNVESPDEADQIIIGGLPTAHNLEIAELLPVREYAASAEDVRHRWGREPNPNRRELEISQREPAPYSVAGKG